MEIIYRNFLGRSISETEVDHFFSGYKSGENFFDVILTIENSEEAQAARQSRQAGPLATRTKSDYVIDTIIQWRASGYVLGPVIRETPRYISYRLERAGQSFFAKLSVSNEAHMMENEVWWALTMSRLTGDNQDVPVRAARILEHGQNWYISEWIEAPLLLEDAWSHGDTLVEPVVDRLVSTLLWLDRLCQSTTANALYYSGSSVPRLHDIETMMEELFATNYISADKLARAIQLVQAHYHDVAPAFQHGDFVPWHIFAVTEQQVCLFDGEHASLTAPRFYDLAYLYGRLYTRSAAPESARQILRRFIAEGGHKEAEFARAFLPVITLRSLVGHIDALADKAHFDYVESARDLLDRSLSRDLKALTSS
jgi:hypothetical protein